MKRDIDLARQLLLDIESQGTDCSFSVLRTGMAHDTDERIRYHLRLLIDAGFVKEIDRTTTGVPCVRLTNSGQEFIELCRSDARWREAKWFVQEQTGGLSLTVLRALLTKWAVETVTRGRRYRRPRRYRPYYFRSEPGYDYDVPQRIETGRYEREPVWEDEEMRYMRPRPEYRERYEVADGLFDSNGAPAYNGEAYDDAVSVTLPVSII